MIYYFIYALYLIKCDQREMNDQDKKKSNNNNNNNSRIRNEDEGNGINSIGFLW